MTAAVSKNTHKALFVDRDGVINKEKEYVWRAEDFEFLPGVFEALREAAEKEFRIIILTNQAGIARGYYSEEDFHRLTEWMLHKFRDRGVRITGVYYDPYHPEYGVGKYKKESLRRKPNPGMLFEAARDHHINLRKSALAGDKLSDVEAGRRAGVGRLFLVRTGHPFDDAEVPDGVEVVRDLGEVVGKLEDGSSKLEA